MKKPHGNSYDNDNDHHLYEIWDTQEKNTYKYGISDDPIEADGLSKRIRTQLALFNSIVSWARFIGKILVPKISGRRKAREIENTYVEDYKSKYGEKPRGNRN